VIDGLVMTFIAITKQKQAEQQRSTNVRRYLEQLANSLREATAMLDTDLQVVMVTQAFLQMLQLQLQEIVGQSLFTLNGGQWSIARVRQWLERLVTHNAPREGIGIALTLPDGERKELSLNAHRIERQGELPMLILITLEERS